jgi:adenosylcobinamide-GDP ribazoletransferase
VSVVVRIGAVASMGPPTAVAALVAAHSLSRAGAAGTMASMPAATSSTLGASYKQSSPRTWIAVAISLAIAALTLGIWSIPAAAIVLGVVIAAGTISMKKIGGFSGDVLGTVQQLSEIGILVLAVAVRNAVPWWHA